MTYNPNKHHRRSIRFKGYDYSGSGLYFITLCTQNRTHLLGEIKNGKMIQNSLASKITKIRNAIPHHFPNTINHEFVIMPNHIHGIIEILETNKTGNEIGKFKFPTKTIGSIIRGFKIGRKKPFAQTEEEIKILKNIDLTRSIWQRSYYEHIIRNDTAYQNISNYILNNPLKWEKDKFYKEN